MAREALMAERLNGLPLPLNPRREMSDQRARADINLGPSHFAISAALSAEDDFELNNEFLEVFVRAGERVMGFTVGCMVIAAIWVICSTL
jgi:hypothetical protein